MKVLAPALEIAAGRSRSVGNHCRAHGQRGTGSAMYTLLHSLPLSRIALEQLPAAAAALIVAEIFYKFGSFSLECLAFLATWYAFDLVLSLFRRGTTGIEPARLASAAPLASTPPPHQPSPFRLGFCDSPTRGGVIRCSRSFFACLGSSSCPFVDCSFRTPPAQVRGNLIRDLSFRTATCYHSRDQFSKKRHRRGESGCDRSPDGAL